MKKIINAESLENAIDEVGKEIIKRDQAVSDESMAAVGALQGEVGELKSAINDISTSRPIPITANKYIDLSGSTVSMSDGHPVFSGDSPTFSVGICECSANDTFVINGLGGSQTRLWGFVNSSGTILEVAKASASGTGLTITAPTNSAFLIIHTKDGRTSYTGDSKTSLVAIVNDEIDNTNAVITSVKNRINDIIGERTIKWEPGYIASSNNQTVDYANIERENQFVHCVVDVVPGEVVHLTGKYIDGIAVLKTVNQNGVQTRASNTSFDDTTYTIPNDTVKIIVTAPVDYPYDVYVESDSFNTIAELSDDVTEISDIVEQLSDSVGKSIRKYGSLTAEAISEGGYTDLIQLPTGFAYAIKSTIDIGGKPVGLQSSAFNFISIPALSANVAVTYTLYLAISSNISYYGFGTEGDTKINWQRIGNGDDNIISLKNKINTILGESITWEKGRIANVSQGSPIVYTALDTDTYVHCVIDVVAGDVVHITSTGGGANIMITVDASGNRSRVSTNASLDNYAYTIAIGDTKIIINARADKPYDVYIKSASTSTIVQLSEETSKSIKRFGLLTAAQITAGEYTDLIQLPKGYVYGIAGSISIGGRPVGLADDPFTFAAIAPSTGVTYSQFYAIGKYCAYYGLGYAGDTTILWRQFEPGEKPFDTIAGPKVVLLGDSITQGVGSSDYSPTGEDLNTSIYPTKRNVGVKAWGAQFVNLLNSEFNCTAVNNGVSQFNATNLKDNLNVLLPSGTDMVVLTIGTNNRGNSVSSFKTAFKTLVRNIKDRGAKLFVFSPIPVNGASASMGMGNMQKVIEEVCQENEITFYPLYTMFRMYIEENNLTLSDYFADTLHPNDAGHKLIYQIVCKCLKV